MQHEGGNIYSVFDELLSRESKEKQLNQKSKVIWLTGLSGSGKTTIAKQLERSLHNEGFFTQLLDGDNIRAGICSDLKFSPEDRKENIRRIAEISKLYLHSGLITINCFISPTEELRALARTIIGTEDFIEVFVNTPLSICEKRDTKGLYAKARKGELKNFTGIDAPFEEPEQPSLMVTTEHKTPKESMEEVLAFVRPMLKNKGE